jgi:DNA replication ATP-dependent helicase Dna2
MVEEIAAYPSEAFYSNSIVTDGKVKKDQEVFMDSFNDKWKKSYLSEVIDPGVPSVCIQVNGGDSMRGFRLNEKEAELCVSIISGFVEAGVRPEQIGVISPFRLQVHTIKVKLSRALGKSYPNILEDLQVDTIDRFQGSEKDIVLLSLCSNGGKNNFLLRDLRRFNVAITRARFKRIILGDLLSFRYGDDEKKRRIAGIINDGVTRLIDSDKLRGR